MGRKFKFAKTELQYSGQNAKPKYMVIEFLPEQVGTLTYTGEELFPTWKNLDPLKLTIEGEISATNAGKHYITVTPTGIFAWPDMTQTPKQIEYVIDRAVIDAVPTQKGTLTFNNTQQSPQWNNFDASKMQIGGVYQNQIHKGNYTATFTPDNNHCWADKTFGSKNVTWSIQVLTLTKPALSQTSYPYTGNAITPTITGFNENFMSKTGDTSGTNVKNNYKITFGLLYPADSQWQGGGTADFDATWQITKVTLAKVTASATTFTYNAQNQEPTWNNYNTTYIVKYGGANENAGTYTTTFSLRDKTNTSWADGSTADITITWVINKLKLPKVTASTTTFTYNAQNQIPTWNNFNETYIYTVWGSDGAKTAAGSYKTTFALRDTDNTSWADGSTANIEITWVINKLKIAKVTASSLEITYTGNAIEPGWQNYNSAYIDKWSEGPATDVRWSDDGWRTPTTSTIQNYSSSFWLKDKNNTCWADNSTADLDYTWKIVPQKVNLPTFKGAYIFDSDGITVTESNFNNVATNKGIELKEEKTYREATTDTARFLAHNGNYAFYYNSAYKLYYDISITITDARFPFKWTDTDGYQRTANNQAQFDSMFPVVNTSTRSLVTQFTIPNTWTAEKFGQGNLYSGEVVLQSASGSYRTYSAVSNANSTGAARMGIHLKSNTGAHIYGNVHEYR